MTLAKLVQPQVVGSLIAGRAAALAALALTGALVGCRGEPGDAAASSTAPDRTAPAPAPAQAATAAFDPLGYARAHKADVGHREAAVPPMCYTRTDGSSNPCWVCHTEGQGRTLLDDSELQASYEFSDAALSNPWTNFFADRRAEVATISDDDITRWIRADNYTGLRQAMASLPASYAGFRPDLDLASESFDELGFARDGSGWRALRYVPFPGAFWPSNGAVGDAFVRLPVAFRSDRDGATSQPIYQLNLALVEAAMTMADTRAAVAGAGRPGEQTAPRQTDRTIEPVDERLLGEDLDGDGRLATATRVRRLPPHYAGAAAAIPVVAWALPQGTELLHTVRYLDPDEPTALSRRLKEVRYMRKVALPDAWGVGQAYAEHVDEKEEGRLPVYQGDAEVGLLNGMGWQLQGFIEDASGRLRLQSQEEHRFCMGCHGAIGVTIDQTFSVARKVPGAAGWRLQDLRGLADLPQLGQRRGELRTYLERVGGGDEHRANDELRARFFPRGKLVTAELDRARPGGSLDLAALLMPSRARALALNKAYLLLVREQSFTRGRAPVLAPVAHMHAQIRDTSTGLGEAKRTYRDGRLLLDWRGATR